MKNITNAFSLLGLDPHYLKHLPDRVTENLVKAVFRVLIMYLHEDHQPREQLDITKSMREDEKLARLQKQFRNVMEAYQSLNTPKGRLEVFSKYRKEKEYGLRERIEELTQLLENKIRKSDEVLLGIILDQLGILGKTAKFTFPLNHFWGGKILVARTFGYEDYWEISLGEKGVVEGWTQCKLTPTKGFKNPKKQLWLLPASGLRVEVFAVPSKMVKPKKTFRIFGTLGEKSWKKLTKEPAGLIESGTKVKASSEDVPFLRLCADEMRKYIYDFEPWITYLSSALSFVDNEGVFYFPGAIRKTMTRREIKEKLK